MIFVSYSRNDKAFVDRLCTALCDANFKVWRDQVKLTLGDSLTANIESAMDQASFLIVVLSDYALASKWVEKEIKAGLLAENKARPLTIVPLLLKDCAIPEPLKDRLFIDFRNDFDTAVRQLLEFLRKRNELDGSHGLVEGADYYQFYGTEVGTIGEQPFVSFEIVSLDRQESYCVLTQVHCVGEDIATVKYFRQAGRPSIKDWVLRACATEFECNPARVILRGSETKTAKFHLASNEARVEVQVRIKRLGAHGNRTQRFNFGAVFQLIIDASMAGARVRRDAKKIPCKVGRKNRQRSMGH